MSLVAQSFFPGSHQLPLTSLFTLAHRPPALILFAHAVPLLARRAANAEELTALKATLEDAEQNHGETEVLDALFGIASFHARVGDKDEAYTAFDVIVDKPKVSTGKKIDASMAKLRVALFFMVRSAGGIPYEM